MPRVAKVLSPLAVSRIATPGMHAVGEVTGLYLLVLPTGVRTWILRASVDGRRREFGLGGFPSVTVADAKSVARRYRQQIAEGTDPAAARRETARSRLAAVATAKTFDQCAAAYIAAHEAGWKNAKHAQQWRNTLSLYASPVMGDLLIRDVELSHVLTALEPIWRQKTETASRLRGRIELVLDWATARGYRDGLNPARWRGHLDKLLPRPSKVARKSHHAALAIDHLGAFMRRLRSSDGVGARALEFVVLTAARSGEVRGAVWSEIDVDTGVWAVPGERMKAGKEHRVPLSSAALDLLRRIPRGLPNELVFSSPRGGQLSDMTLTAVLRRMKVEAVPHGFRSTFRDWAAERTNYPGELAEMALAHTIGDKVEAAYRRGDMFEKRRRMMEEWAAFAAVEHSSAAVISLPKSRHSAA